MLDSLITFGCLNKDIEILVYTSTEFRELIQDSQLFQRANEICQMIFAINNTYNNVDAACKARLDLFDLEPISKYSKVLYLDTDIIIRDDITKLFRLELADKLYALKEGNIKDRNNSHGYLLFKRAPFKIPANQWSAFTTGILLFNNCDKIRELFSEVKKIIIKWPNKFHCADQPYIIYMAFKMRLYDNNLMCTYAVNNSTNLNSGKILHHFNGGPGVYGHKIPAMTDFLGKLKLLNISGDIKNPI